MKPGDLVHFVQQPRIGHYEVKEDTLGIVLGFSTSGRVRIQWFDDFMVLLNENPNYWQWAHLKVIEKSS